MREFEELWEQVASFKAARPQMPHTTVFHAEKGREEAQELVEAVYSEERQAIVSEGSDVLINWIQLMQAEGIHPIHALHYAFIKLDELEQRYPPSRFDGTNGKTYQQNYQEAKYGKPDGIT